MRTALLPALLLFSSVVVAQAIPTSGVERDPGGESFWRLSYDNDFFTATDRYFTQGIAIEVAARWVRRIPVSRALIAPGASHLRYSLAYEDDGYTPSDLKAAAVLVGDRPYAGTKQLRIAAVALDTVRRRRVTSSLNVGIVGQGAGGAEIQTFIHRHTGNTIPRGWVHQIRNDLILNYEAGVERELLHAGSRLSLTGSGVARIGTYNSSASVGATLMVGRIGSPFSNALRSSRAAYVYLRPQVSLIGYDATLQGGLFNRASPYTIAAGDLRRIVARQYAGVVYRRGNWFAEYYQSVLSPEFTGADRQRSGGFIFGRHTHL
jgi:lipid A 3-O-deacylase